MDRNRILAIEDDAGVCRILRHSLAREDFDLQIVSSGSEGLAIARDALPDLVLLDLGLPDLDGLEVCRQLKSAPETRHLPIVILTGKGEESDVVSGLEMGADDYIIKPFRPRILNARIRAVLRRRMEASGERMGQETLHVGRLIINPGRETLTLADETLELSPSEFHFIHALTRSLLHPDADNTFDPALAQEGMSLYAENRLDRLLPIFSELLGAAQPQHPLLYKFAGLAQLHSDTRQAETLLNKAAHLFHVAGNPVAELSLLSHLVLLHVFLDGDIEKAAARFRNADRLANQHFEQLNVFSRISVAQAQAVGHALLNSNFGRAYEYLSVAEALAEDRGLENFRAINLLVHAYEAYLAADLRRLSRTVDETLLLLNHPQISATNKALLKMVLLIHIAQTGDFAYFRSVEQALRDEFDVVLPASSFPSCLLTVLQAQMAQAEGRHEKVLALRTAVLQNRLHQPVMSGMVALSAALSGQTEAAIDAITATLAFDQTIPSVDLLGRLYCIRALLALDRTSEAAGLMEKVQIALESARCRQIEIQSLGLSLLFFRTRPLNSQHLNTLQRLLGDMKLTGVRNLRCLTRDDLRFLYCTAVQQNVERPFAIDLCRNQLQIGWDRDWEPVPILQFRTLGGLQLASDGRLLLSHDDFSRSQRECLALLFASPKNRIDQEEMQLIFWPESPPDKARANLDTMLSRLRKTVQVRIKPLAFKNYLKLQKGVISLDLCAFDCEQLLDNLEAGRNALRNRELWKADIALTRALDLWQGDFMPGACATDRTTEFADRIRTSSIDTTLAWGETLIEIGQSIRAVAILERTLAHDRCNEDLVIALYRCHMRSKNLGRAALLLRQYEDALKKDHFPAAEIGRLLARIRSGPRT